MGAIFFSFGEHAPLPKPPPLRITNSAGWQLCVCVDEGVCMFMRECVCLWGSVYVYEGVWSVRECVCLWGGGGLWEGVFYEGVRTFMRGCVCLWEEVFYDVSVYETRCFMRDEGVCCYEGMGLYDRVCVCLWVSDCEVLCVFMRECALLYDYEGVRVFRRECVSVRGSVCVWMR